MAAAQDELREMVLAGARSRWGWLTEDIQARLDYELGTVAQCGQVDYILMAARLAAAIRAAGGRISPGRGACAASAVLYALGITNVDPTKYDLPFEHFMLPERERQRPVLIDTDARGNVAARAFLSDAYGGYEELPRDRGAPQTLNVNGWEICVTLNAGVERLADMVELVHETTGEVVDTARLPLDDRAPLEAFRRRELVGLPRYDHPAIQKSLSSLPDTTFGELVNLGTLSFSWLCPQRDAYIARRLGRTKAPVVHPLLNGILGETCGLVVYVEQILLILRRLAGFTRGEAYQCQRAVGKRKRETMEQFAQKFISGCMNNPAFRIGECADEEQATGVAEAIWDDIEQNGWRAFIKGHVVAAARLAYELGYLQCHYRSEWIYLDGKEVRPEPRRSVASEMVELYHISDALDSGCRVTLLMRHAERPPLGPGDTTSGERLPLTMDGIGQARDFGTFLSGRVSPAGVRIFAGNTLRAIQTAETIRGALEDGSGTRARDIGLVPELGDDSPFFRERDERMALIAGGRYLERLNDYFRTGFQQGYRPLAAATDAMEHVLERLAGRHKEVVVAITHDINVAAFLAGRGVVAAFDEETWPHYGDAAVIIRNDEGKIEYGYYRRDYTPDDDDL